MEILAAKKADGQIVTAGLLEPNLIHAVATDTNDVLTSILVGGKLNRVVAVAGGE